MLAEATLADLRARLARVRWRTHTDQDSSKGGVVETGCSGLYYIIGYFTI